MADSLLKACHIEEFKPVLRIDMDEETIRYLEWDSIGVRAVSPTIILSYPEGHKPLILTDFQRQQLAMLLLAGAEYREVTRQSTIRRKVKETGPAGS